LLLHGGGLCKEIFTHQLESGLGSQHRVIAIDFPGHGESEDATDPKRAYSVAGLADVALQVLEGLDIDAAVVVGVSLGGRVALELIQTYPGLIGLCLTGVPLASARARSIVELPEFDLVGAPGYADERMNEFLRRALGEVDVSPFRSGVRRADQTCLRMIAEQLRAAVDGWPTAEEVAKTPVLGIGGTNNPVLNTGRESGGRRAQSRFTIVQSGPAPYLQVPEIFNNILGSFMTRMVRRERQMAAAPHTWYGG
jgi:pimeloyl-ACP methyl ester carboxylesterase